MILSNAFDQLPPIWGWKRLSPPEPLMVFQLSINSPPHLGMETLDNIGNEAKEIALILSINSPQPGDENSNYYYSAKIDVPVFSFDQLFPTWGWKPFFHSLIGTLFQCFRSTPPNPGMETAYISSWEEK